MVRTYIVVLRDGTLAAASTELTKLLVWCNGNGITLEMCRVYAVGDGEFAPVDVSPYTEERANEL